VRTGGAPRRREDVAQVDRRWVLTVAAVFATALGAAFAAVAIYRATGPHPAVRSLLRRLKLHANQLLRHGFRRP